MFFSLGFNPILDVWISIRPCVHPAPGTPPEFWKVVDCKLLVEDKSPWEARPGKVHTQGVHWASYKFFVIVTMIVWPIRHFGLALRLGIGSKPLIVSDFESWPLLFKQREPCPNKKNLIKIKEINFFSSTGCPRKKGSFRKTTMGPGFTSWS